MKSHIEGVHEKIRSNVCGECGYGAFRKKDLKNHIEAVHENIRSHTCGQCDYAASSKGTLKQHIEGVHEKRAMSAKSVDMLPHKGVN